MQSEATTVDAYLDELPADRQAPMRTLRDLIVASLPPGFEEGMGYGMIGYWVPHSLYPAGYHVNPKLPLPFVNLASQKQYISLYHMALYANTPLYDWFVAEYAKTGYRLDMGKGCIRFKRPDQIPYPLIGRLLKRVTPSQYIHLYETALQR